MNDILLELLSLYGIKEIAGPEHNQIIVNMFAEIGYPHVKDDDSTAWCSAALNYICKKLGYERSGELTARSWLKMPIIVLKPTLGDIAIFWREDKNGWKGHVGLYISETKDSIYVLGGNQNNQINIMPYPKANLLGYRQTKKIK